MAAKECKGGGGRSSADRAFGFKSPEIVRIITGADILEVEEALDLLGFSPGELLEEIQARLDLQKERRLLFVEQMVEFKDRFTGVNDGLENMFVRLLISIEFAIRELFEDPAPGEAEAGRELQLLPPSIAAARAELAEFQRLFDISVIVESADVAEEAETRLTDEPPLLRGN